MTVTIHFGHPNEATEVVQQIQTSLDAQEDEWHVLGNLFNPDRLDMADEAVFLKDEDGTVVPLGLICKLYPNVLSYYTAPIHRRNGHGYTLLIACISRILENDSDALIFIEPTNKSADDHIMKLPDELRQRLRIV